MNRITLVVAALAATATLGLAACGSDDETATNAASAEPVSVTGAWARVTPPKAPAGAAYMTITSAEGDMLTGVSVPADVAGEAQLHETTDQNAAMAQEMAEKGESPTAAQMQQMMKGMKEVEMIDLPAGEAVQLKPGGYHVMLMKLKAPITEGMTIPVTLTFEKAGEVTVDAVAKES
jgi:copper(I)-binding protein